jgi:hypothetical protein
MKLLTFKASTMRNFFKNNIICNGIYSMIIKQLQTVYYTLQKKNIICKLSIAKFYFIFIFQNCFYVVYKTRKMCNMCNNIHTYLGKCSIQILQMQKKSVIKKGFGTLETLRKWATSNITHLKLQSVIKYI